VYEKYLGRVKQGLDERIGEEVLAFGCSCHVAR